MSLTIIRDAGEFKEMAMGLEKEYCGFEFISSNTNESFFLIEDGKLIGGADFQVAYDTADVLFVYIIRTRRGEGLSKILFKECLDSLVEKGVREIFLEVRKTNKAAIALYLSSGFKEISERKKYYDDGEDAIVMKLSR